MNETNGRDAMTGKFAPGNKGGPGNGMARRMHAMRKVFADCVTEDDVKDAYAELMKAVRAGDMTAIREFFDRTLGKASQAVEISGPDGSSLDLTTVVSVIMLALGDDQDARGRVAAAFRRMGSIDGLDAAGLGG
jgi:hypothetical protein